MRFERTVKFRALELSHPIRKWVFGRCFYLRSLVLQTPMVVVGITVIPGAAVMLGRMVSHHHVLASCFHAMSAMHAKLHFVLPSVERSPTQPRCDYPSPSLSLCSAGSWVCFICISNSRLYNALVYQQKTLLFGQTNIYAGAPPAVMAKPASSKCMHNQSI